MSERLGIVGRSREKALGDHGWLRGDCGSRCDDWLCYVEAGCGDILERLGCVRATLDWALYDRFLDLWLGDGCLRGRFDHLDGRLGGAHAEVAHFGGMRLVECRVDELYLLQVAALLWDLFALFENFEEFRVELVRWFGDFGLGVCCFGTSGVFGAGGCFTDACCC